jgi:O-antigen ligase
MVSIAIAMLLMPLVLSSFEQRFSGYTISNYDERAAMEKSASMMVSDHPWGVGANSYVLIANTEGYNSRAGVAPDFGSESANVHNVYYLITAESGYVGLVTFVLVLLGPLVVAFRCAWRYRRDPRGDLLLGIGMSLLVVYIHSFFEWVFITFSLQYMFALSAGMIAGTAKQLGYWRSPVLKTSLAVAGH